MNQDPNYAPSNRLMPKCLRDLKFDEQGFASWVGSLVKEASNRGEARRDSEDDAQEAFRRFYRALLNKPYRFTSRGRLAAFFIRTLQRVRARRRRHEAVVQAALPRLTEQASIAQDSSPNAIDATSPEATLSEAQAAVHAVLARRSDDDRLLFLLRSHGLPYHRIADLLELPLGTISRRLCDLIRWLTDTLRREYPALFPDPM